MKFCYNIFISLHIVLLLSYIFVNCQTFIYKDTTRDIYVADQVISSENLHYLKRYVTVQPLQFNPMVDKDIYRGGFNTRLYNKPSKAPVIQLKKFALNLLHYDKKELKLQSFAGKVFDIGDFIPIQSCSNSNSSFILYIILSDTFKKNSYGDFAIYDDFGEIIQSFHPKLGRTFLLNCNNTMHRFWPPSLEMEKRLSIFAIEFGFSKIPHKVFEMIRLSKFLRNRLSNDTYFDAPLKINPESYLTKKIITVDGKRIFVFDGIFDLDLVALIYEYVTEHAAYFAEEIDVESEDNVRWIIGLEEPNFDKGKIWSILKEVIIFVSGVNTYTPYDVSINHIRRTDSTTIHKDCKLQDNELTSLLYINPDWSEHYYGETVYMKGDELITSVVPRFGRLVVFDGNIDHSARPPSPDFHGARFTLAVKSAINAKAAQIRKRDMASA